MVYIWLAGKVIAYIAYVCDSLFQELDKDFVFVQLPFPLLIQPNTIGVWLVYQLDMANLAIRQVGQPHWDLRTIAHDRSANSIDFNGQRDLAMLMAKSLFPCDSLVQPAKHIVFGWLLF